MFIWFADGGFRCSSALCLFLNSYFTIFGFVSPGAFCPVGTFNNVTGLRAANECTPCSPGSYCATEGLIEPTGQCNAGHYCELASTQNAPVGQSYGYLCPVGNYCPQGTPQPQPCIAGTYQPLEGQYIRYT